MTGPDKIFVDAAWANTFTEQTDPMQQEYHRTAAHPVTVEVLTDWANYMLDLDCYDEIRAAIAQIEAMK